MFKYRICKQCIYVRFKGTMTKWPVQKLTHRTKQKHEQTMTQQTFKKLYFCVFQILEANLLRVNVLSVWLKFWMWSKWSVQSLAALFQRHYYEVKCPMITSNAHIRSGSLSSQTWFKKLPSGTSGKEWMSCDNLFRNRH